MFGVRRALKGLIRGVLRPRPEPPRPPAARRPTPEPEPDATSIEVEADEVVKWIAERPVVLLDVREPNELYAGHAEGALLVPMRQVEARLDEIPADVRVVAYCAAGARSHGVAELLRARGRPDTWSLAGGFGAYAAAGGATVRPPAAAKFPIASRVLVDGAPGTVQGIEETSDGMRYTIRRVADGRVIVDTGVTEARLARS